MEPKIGDGWNEKEQDYAYKYNKYNVNYKNNPTILSCFCWPPFRFPSRVFLTSMLALPFFTPTASPGCHSAGEGYMTDCGIGRTLNAESNDQRANDVGSWEEIGWWWEAGKTSFLLDSFRIGSGSSSYSTTYFFLHALLTQFTSFFTFWLFRTWVKKVALSKR